MANVVALQSVKLALSPYPLSPSLPFFARALLLTTMMAIPKIDPTKKEIYFATFGIFLFQISIGLQACLQVGRLKDEGK